MHFLDDTVSDGVREQLFSLGDIPGVLWTPADERPRALILMGHGGGQHKKAPAMVERARRFVLDGGWAVVVADAPGHGDRPTDETFDRLATELQARVGAGEEFAPLMAGFHEVVAGRTVGEWRAVLDAVQRLDGVGAGPVGYFGVSLGCGLGVPFVAAEPRVRSAVLGLGGGAANTGHATRITAPVQFLMQWDDERIPRADGLALFDAFGSAEKTLHASSGRHGELPRFELDANVAFFRRHLGGPPYISGS
ncbi:alpha/beta hydrolase family protein [Actinoplanes sp. RD1]|uniref:alpha/beta hydrolase family protein n=1 Tax=Actinoplanes sp. RD1 TaxID=3064538 RepID=UPI002741901F|nr:alpha/beta hydrolase [Actinoplanes sp. RD1]